MSYRIDLGQWNSIFAVPSSVADKHLKLATEAQLKALLYILRNSGRELSDEDISRATGVSVEEIANALSFWVERGLLKCSDGELIPAESSALSSSDTPEAKPEQPKKQTSVSRAVRPDSAFVGKLIKEDPNLAGLMDEAQTVLKKTLSPGDTAILVMLYDSFGLPCEVIAMLLHYVASLGNPNMRAVEKIGISWSDNSVFSVEAAEAEIERMASSREAWGRAAALIGLHNAGNPTAAQMNNAERWLVTWGFNDDMIVEAYERCVNKKGEFSMSYMNGILKKWYEKKIFSLETLKAQEEASSKRSSSKASSKGSVFSEEGASFSLSTFESKSLFDD